MIKIKYYRTIEEIQAIIPLWIDLQNAQQMPTFDADHTRYITVAKAFPERKPFIVVLKSGNSSFMLIGWENTENSKAKIGYLQIPTFKLTVFNIVYGGAIGQLPNSAMKECYTLLSNLLKHNFDLIHFNHLQKEDPIYQLVTSNFPPTKLHLFNSEPHWQMNIPDHIDSFFAKLSAKHRGNLKRSIKKLKKDFNSQYIVKKYEDLEDIDTIFKDIAYISAKTYQHGLGAGFEDTPSKRIIIEEGLQQKRYTFYIMYIKNEPISFREDLSYKGTISSQEIGFDPEWRKYSIGNALFLESLLDICTSNTYKIYDFGFGNAQYKKSYGDKQWDEFNLGIYSSRLKPKASFTLNKLIKIIDQSLRTTIKRTGLERKTKKIWRTIIRTKATK